MLVAATGAAGLGVGVEISAPTFAVLTACWFVPVLRFAIFAAISARWLSFR